MATDTADCRVRWKVSGRWRYGHINGDEKEGDGSLRIYDDYSGSARSLPVAAVQRQVRGPRGGRYWEPFEPVESQPSSDHPVGWEQLEMFGGNAA